jgi:hypothetical protein
MHVGEGLFSIIGEEICAAVQNGGPGTYLVAADALSKLRPSVQQLLQSTQLLRLLAAMQAVTTELLQRQVLSKAARASTTSSSRNRGRPQPSAAAAAAVAASGEASASAAALLNAAGMAWPCSAVQLQAPIVQAFEAMMLHSMRLVQNVWMSWMRLLLADLRANGSSSSSNGSSSSIVTPDIRSLLESLLQPWSLLQVQQLLLVTTPEATAAALYGLLGLCSTMDYLDPAATAAATSSLLQPVLLQLLPHVQGIISGAGGGSSSSSSRRPGSSSSSAADDAWRISTMERRLSQLLLALSDGGEGKKLRWQTH